MEEKLTQIFSVWGWKGIIIVALVFILSFVAKWPLKKWAVKQVELGKIADKKVVTKWFFAIPIVIAFLLTFMCELWTRCNWDVALIDWAVVSTGTATFAVAPAAIYEWFDNFYKSGQATAAVKQAEKETEAVSVATVDAKEQKRVAKIQTKVAKLELKKAKIQKKIDALRVDEATVVASKPIQQAQVDQFGNAVFK